MGFQDYLKILNLKNYSEATIKTYRLYFSNTELGKNIKTTEIYTHITNTGLKSISSLLD